MAAARREVRSVDGRRGWRVVTPDSPLSSAVWRTKVEAVEEASRQLSAHGGKLTVYLADGRLDYTRMITSKEPAEPAQPSPEQFAQTRDDVFDRIMSMNRMRGSILGVTPPERPAAPPAAPPQIQRVAEEIYKEGRVIDERMSDVEKVLSVVLPLAGWSVSAFASPEVGDAAGSGWLAVFFATLTLSLACLGSTVLLKVATFPVHWLVAGCFFIFCVAIVVANGVGAGMLDIQLPSAPGSLAEQLQFIFSVLVVALETYGPVGFILGSVIGIWLGHRLAPLFR